MKIVINPKTKILYLATSMVPREGCNMCYGFDGTPYTLNVEGWEVYGEAESLFEWQEQPGKSQTFYGTIRVTIIEKDGTTTMFDKGEAILYLYNWIRDHQSNGILSGATVGYQWLNAYSDRNFARKAGYDGTGQSWSSR